jgi:trehalose 6-phosphate synthase
MNRLVVVSNRVPVPSDISNQAGGLAVALGGLMQKRGGVWFGWSGRVSPGAATAAPTITCQGDISFITVDLTAEEHTRYYSNFSNGVLWPLLHTMPELMTYDRRDAQVYRQVNERLADQLCPLLRPHDLVWVHDYHLMALPALLRARGIRNPIGFFLHIPFPAVDVLGTAPEAANLTRDLLAADLVGFQTDRDLDNFATAAETIAGATLHHDGWIHTGGRRVRVGAFPVEIEARDFAAAATRAWRSAAAERLRRSLRGQQLILGVDRLDPTKGLLQRLAGYRRLLEMRPEWRQRTTMLQIAAVSRKEVAPYQELRVALDREAGSINSEYGEADWTPLRIVARAGARNVVAGYMREARVGLVTPLRDGMNLVAKEFVAAQNPADPGVLILSRFAGAARQLEEALLVNPHDPDDIADALNNALRMELSERQHRWKALWQRIENATPLNWGRSFLAALLRAALAADAPLAGRSRIHLDRPSEPLPIVCPSLTPDTPDRHRVN